MSRVEGWLRLGFFVLVPAPLVAQDYVGPQKCVTCHASLAAPSWKKYHEGSLAQVDKGQGPQ